MLRAAFASLVLTLWLALGCSNAGALGDAEGAFPLACAGPKPTPGNLAFEEVALARGVDFVHHPATGMCDVVDTVGGPSVCSFDYDGDGDIDLYFTDRAPYPNRLYRNGGAGQFTDVTAESGAGLLDDSASCLAFDYDGDGDLDLFVGNTGPDRLLRNDGGTFTDVTAESGIVEEGFSTTATAGDIDGDGDLDLFVGHLVDPASCPGKPYCWPSPGMCAPQKNALFVNDGGVFRDVTAERGLSQAEPTLSSLLFDLDEDGDLDLFVGNDIGSKFPDRLYRNDGKGGFAEVGQSLGLDLPGTDTMGIDVGDADGDGKLDLVVSDYKDKPVRLVTCKDPAGPCEMVGIDKESQASVKWSIALVDLDHDRDLDIFTVGGNTSTPKGYLGEPHQIHYNDGTGLYSRAAQVTGDPLAEPHIGRGAAFADIDGDSDVDVIVANANGPAQVLLNQGAAGYGLLVELDSLSAGARVTVTGGGQTRVEQVLIGGTYAGSSDPRVHFGLGDTCIADVSVTWLGGESKTVRGVRAGERLRIER